MISRTVGPLLLILALAGCSLLRRPNPQLPPELAPPEGPTAAAAGPRLEPETATTTATPASGAAGPEATTPAGSVATEGSSLPSPAERPAVALPNMPPPSEGKSGPILIEPLDRVPAGADLPALPDDERYRRALRQWHQGPVRYIILKQEEDLFRRLETDEDRLGFIEDFWARRDRQPETDENEDRAEFWRRVADADRQFIDSTRTGWRTDRGRIWILMGPPDQVETFLQRGKGPDVLRWTYRERPNPVLEPNFIVAFRRSPSGEWELSNSPADFDPIFRDMIATIEPLNLSQPFSSARFGTQGVQEFLPRLSLYLDLGQALAPPELYRLRSAEPVVETREVFGAMDLRTSFEFLSPAPDGGVRTGVVVGVLKGSLVSERDADEADSNLGIDLSIYPGDTEDPAHVVRVRDGFGASRENYVATAGSRLLFRAETTLEPGPHLAVYRLLDRTSGQAAQARETIVVPERFAGDELILSSIILARQMSPFDPSLERSDAFTLGRFRVVPNLDATYRNGGLLALYYQVHGALFDPATGRRHVDVALHFAAQQGESWLELGDPIVYHDQENPQGWSAPMRDWPPATYRVTITVTDRIAGTATTGFAYFRVLPGS